MAQNSPKKQFTVLSRRATRRPSRNSAAEVRRCCRLKMMNPLTAGGARVSAMSFKSATNHYGGCCCHCCCCSCSADCSQSERYCPTTGSSRRISAWWTTAEDRLDSCSMQRANIRRRRSTKCRVAATVQRRTTGRRARSNRHLISSRHHPGHFRHSDRQTRSWTSLGRTVLMTTSSSLRRLYDIEISGCLLPKYSPNKYPLKETQMFWFIS